MPDVEPWLGHAAMTLAVLAASQPDGDVVLARVGDSTGADARRGLAYLHALPADVRRVMIARWRVRVRMPVPDGVRAVHPTQLEAAIAEAGEGTRGALGGVVSTPQAVALARSVTASWPRMPAVQHDAGGPPADVAALVAMPSPWIVAALRRVGALHLDAARRLAAGTATAADRALGPSRAVLRRIRGEAIERPGCLERIGLRAVAAHLHATSDGARQLLLRLPVELVAQLRAVLEEPAALDDAPAWSALLTCVTVEP